MLIFVLSVVGFALVVMLIFLHISLEALKNEVFYLRTEVLSNSQEHNDDMKLIGRTLLDMTARGEQ